MSGPTFVNWPAVGAVVLLARADEKLSNAEFRLAVEVAARIDPETGKARVSVRDLAAALHTEDTRSIRRRLRTLIEERGYFERGGTGRPGYATEANTETYALGGAVVVPLTGRSRGGATPPHAVERGGATPPRRGGATPPAKDRESRLTPQQRMASLAAQQERRPGGRPPAPGPPRIGAVATEDEPALDSGVPFQLAASPW